MIRQAQALLEQRRFQLQDEGRSVTQAVAAAWSQFDVAQANIVARREQAEAARIAAEGVAEEARLGARSTLDVLDADQERLQAEAEIVQAVRDEYVAAYSLLRAMGLLTVKHLNLGIETYNPDVYFTEVQSGPSGGYDTGRSTGSAPAGSATEAWTSRASPSPSPRSSPRSGRSCRPRPSRGAATAARAPSSC